MKISKQNMEKLGFRKYGNFYQHKNHTSLIFRVGELSWDKVIQSAVDLGYKHGKNDTQSEMKKALGIY